MKDKSAWEMAGRFNGMVATNRATFDKQLNELNSQVLQVAELVEVQAEQAICALQKHDLEVAHRVNEFDKTINQKRYEIEERCYTLLALQQPNSRDMRRIVANVSVVTNLERMGDHAAGIARLVLRLPETISEVPEFGEMMKVANANLRDAMIGFAHNDTDLVREVVRRDAQIDALHKKVYDRLIKLMIADPTQIECATMLLWVSHNIERYADRISNICERIIYMVTGNLHEPRPVPVPTYKELEPAPVS